MKESIKIGERLASMTIGTALMVMGLILIALGLTIFPVIGILMAVPVMGLAFGCFRPNAWTIATQSETDVDSNISEPLAA